MGIFTNLAKGFITSAVNQVGRDGGKVISNKIYGNSHSSPTNLITSSESTNYNNLTEEELNSNINLSQNRIETSWDTIKYIFISLFSLFIPYFGLPLNVYLAYKNSKKTIITIYHKERRAVYAQDNRHRNGQRHNGYTEIRVPTKTTANEIEINYLKRKSKIYYIIALFSVIFWLFVIGINLFSKK